MHHLRSCGWRPASIYLPSPVLLAPPSSFRGAKRLGISLLLRLAPQERFLATLGMTRSVFFPGGATPAQTSARLPVLLWQRHKQSLVRPSQRRRENPPQHPPRPTPPPR